MKKTLRFSQLLVCLAAWFGVAGLATDADAHTTQICWRCESDGSVTFFAKNWHTGPSSPVGGVLVDGRQFNFTQVITSLPSNLTGCGPRWSSLNGYVQVVNVQGLAPGLHTISTTNTSAWEAPLGAFTANIQCCNLQRSTITFSEPLGRTFGFNGRTNFFLRTADGDYHAEFFWLRFSGHHHVTTLRSPNGTLYERNHNNSNGNSSVMQGIRIRRLDGRPFTLESMGLEGQAAVGHLTSISTGAGTWSLFSRSGYSTVSFGSQFSNVNDVFIVDPGVAGGSSRVNCWDNIVLSTCQSNQPPAVNCPQPTNFQCDGGNATADINLSVNLVDPDGDALTVRWYVNGTLVQTDGPTTASTASLTHTFPLGTSSVGVVVSDGQASDSCSTTVTVVDTVNPVIMCADDVDVGTDAGQCYATVTLQQPIVNDDCQVASLSNDAPATFPLGQTTVTWTVTDVGGNTATCTQLVTVVDNEPPSITCPADVSVVHDAGTCVATGVTLGQASATDNCTDAGPVTISNDAPAEFQHGTTLVVWTATDAAGNQASCVQEVTVTNQAPIANAGADQVVECNSTGSGTPVTLSAVGSSDPDDPFSSLTFQWSAVGITFDDATSSVPTANFPLGSTTVSLEVTDPCGDSSTVDVIITVQDTTAPQIQAAVVDQKVLWPPNHDIVPIAMDLLVSDTCENPQDLTINCVVSSNEPDDELGDGAFTGDVNGADGYTAPVPVTLSYNPLSGKWEGNLSLRAERLGNGTGRKYSVICSAADSSGNTTSATVCVTVPHSKKGGK